MIILDTETTGIDYRKHSIVSLGALDSYNPKHQFYEECRIFEGTEIDSESLKINGFTIGQITDKNKQSLEQLMKEFFKWEKHIHDKTLAGQNVHFDANFTKFSAELYNLKYPFSDKRFIDLHSICYADHLKRGFKIPLKDGKSDLSLDHVLRYAGLPKEPKPHNALTGAELEAEALSRLIYGKNLIKEFKVYKIPKHLL